MARRRASRLDILAWKTMVHIAKTGRYLNGQKADRMVVHSAKRYAPSFQKKLRKSGVK